MILKLNMQLFLVFLVMVPLCAALDDGVTVEINTHCAPKNAITGTEYSKELHVDAMYVFVVNKKTKEIKHRVPPGSNSIVDTDAKAWNFKVANAEMKKVDAFLKDSANEVEVVVFIRRQHGIKGDNPIYYGYKQDNMKWHTSTDNAADGHEFDIENAININRLLVTFNKAPVVHFSTATAFDCNNPSAWIANHGIYAISKDGIRNIYYDPSRSHEQYRVDYLS